LLGPNGQGKTTLLKHMAQRKIRGISPNISVLLVEQELAFDDDTNVVQAVLRADKKTRSLLGMLVKRIQQRLSVHFSFPNVHT
jgi:ATP-binding cassette subfamily F protein 1